MKVTLGLAFALILSATGFAQTRYFGPFDCDETCMDRVHTFSNVAMIRIHPGNPERDVQQIEHARRLGMKVILSYFPQYLQEAHDRNAPGQQRQWDKWVGAVRQYQDAVVAIYPFDEPYLAAIRRVAPLRQMSKGQANSIKKSAKGSLATAAGRIKRNFPNAALIYVEAHTLVNDELEIPEGFDWIGTDCYDNWDSCQGRSIPEYYEILKSKMNGGQKLVAVLPGFIREGGNGPHQPQQLADLARRYGTFIRGNPRFAAGLIWTYQSYPKLQSRGLDQMDPSLLAGYAAVAREIGAK